MQPQRLTFISVPQAPTDANWTRMHRRKVASTFFFFFVQTSEQCSCHQLMPLEHHSAAKWHGNFGRGRERQVSRLTQFYVSVEKHKSLKNYLKKRWKVLENYGLFQTAGNLQTFTPEQPTCSHGCFSLTILFTTTVSCSLTLLPPPAKHNIDKTSPCTWHSKVNRLFNPLSWHAYEVWAVLSCPHPPQPPSADGAFVFHLLQGTGGWGWVGRGAVALRKRKNSRGSKVCPWGPSLPNVPCCTRAVLQME